jgi:hypothetical protein
MNFSSHACLRLLQYHASSSSHACVSIAVPFFFLFPCLRLLQYRASFSSHACVYCSTVPLSLTVTTMVCVTTRKVQCVSMQRKQRKQRKQCMQCKQRKQASDCRNVARIVRVYGVRFFDRKFHSRMSLVPTPARLTLMHACDQQHSSRVFTSFTGWYCKLHPNTEGTSTIQRLRTAYSLFTLHPPLRMPRASGRSIVNCPSTYTTGGGGGSAAPLTASGFRRVAQIQPKTTKEIRVLQRLGGLEQVDVNTVCGSDANSNSSTASLNATSKVNISSGTNSNGASVKGCNPKQATPVHRLADLSLATVIESVEQNRFLFIDQLPSELLQMLVDRLVRYPLCTMDSAIHRSERHALCTMDSAI